MKYKVIVSKKDTASLNIYKELKKLEFPEENIKTIQGKSYEAENLEIDADFLIFATKHSSTSLQKTLTVHNPGNWTKADFGGKDSILPPSTASVLKIAYLELKKNNKLGYDTSGEATHHGPFIKTPSLFIEIGSSMLEWKDEKAAKVIAKTILDIINIKPKKYKTAIGLGGGHYMPSFNKILERTDIALAYVCPKHHLEFLNEDLLNQAINNSTEKIDFILVDWKGLGPHKEKIKELANKVNLPIKRIKEVLTNSDI